MSDENLVEKLREAKEALKEEFGECAWFRGAGIAPDADSDSGLVLRLNVDRDSLESDAEVPPTYRGLKVKTVFIQGYEKRSSAKRKAAKPEKGEKKG